MKRNTPSRQRTLADRVFGLAFIALLLYIAHLSWTGQLGDKAGELVDWLEPFFV